MARKIKIAVIVIFVVAVSAAVGFLLFEKPSKTKEKPSEPAVKPSEPAVKPSETKVKPSETKVKPSETKEKPSEPAVKPEKSKHAECRRAADDNYIFEKPRLGSSLLSS